MDISVVIPLYNEAESLPELFAWIERVMKEHNFSYEVIFINDGSTDNSWEVIEALKSKNPEVVHAVKFRRNYGKSPGLNCGFQRAKGDVVITMDADLQDSPDEIPELYRMITEEGYDLVSGWKKKRYDPLSKTIPTKLFNATARKFSGITNLHDFNCGLKAYKNIVIKNIEVYNDMHRYIPYLAKIAGFSKIGEKVVKHQARKYGTTKFGLNRFVNGYLDLITLWFTSKFGKKPMHFFGLWGSVMFFIGFIALVIVLSAKLISICTGDLRPLVTNSPYFYVSLTAMILGTQMFLAGFIGELISRDSPNRNKYKIETELAQKRCSIRKYASSPVEDEKLAYILEAGRMAPSAVNFQPWYFVIIRQEAGRAKIQECYAREWFRSAPLYILVCGDHSQSWKRSSDRKDHMDIDVAIATEHISLAAAEQGLGSCWVCNFDTDLCRKHFNLPDTIEPAVILTIGYPESPDLFEQTSKKRKTLEEIIKEETF